jgi:hypothetical protein
MHNPGLEVPESGRLWLNHIKVDCMIACILQLIEAFAGHKNIHACMQRAWLAHFNRLLFRDGAFVESKVLCNRHSAAGGSGNAALMRVAAIGDRPFWEGLRHLQRLHQPIMDGIHQLEGGKPLLSQIDAVWRQLVTHAEK